METRHGKDTESSPLDTLLVFYGLPGVGKSTLIREFIKYHPSYQVIAIDDVWDQCFEHPSYTIDESAVVFEALLDRIRAMLLKRTPVVVEGVFATKHRLQDIKDLSLNFDFSFRSILLKLSADTVKNRLLNRNNARSVSSHAWAALREKMDSTKFADIVLDGNSCSSENLLRELEKELT